MTSGSHILEVQRLHTVHSRNEVVNSKRATSSLHMAEVDLHVDNVHYSDARRPSHPLSFHLIRCEVNGRDLLRPCPASQPPKSNLPIQVRVQVRVAAWVGNLVQEGPYPYERLQVHMIYLQCSASLPATMIPHNSMMLTETQLPELTLWEA